MAETADSVVVELIAKTDGYTAAVNGAAAATATGMSKIEQSASKAEASIQNSADSMASSFKRAANDIGDHTARIANAQRNLGRQIADIGVGFSGGQNPFLILAQQAPQVADALADTGGAASKVAAFFAGPWGAALLAAGSALGVLLPKLLEAGEGVDALVKKLEDNSTKARLASDAQAIFAKSLYGTADASAALDKQLTQQNKSQLQVAESALISARALRQQSIQNLQDAVAKAELARTDAKANADPANFTGGSAPGLAAAAQNDAQARTTRNLATANERLANARSSLARAEHSVVEASVPILKTQASEQADASVSATNRHTRAVDALTAAYVRAQAAAAKLGGAAGNSARVDAVRTFRAGVSGADRQLASDQDAIHESSKRAPRGPSAASLARQAEAARVKGVRNDEAYETEKEQANQQIIAARRSQVVEASQLAAMDRDAVASELKKRLAQIDADESTKKFDHDQAEDLRAKANSLAAVKNAGITLTLTQKEAEEQLAAAEAKSAIDRDSALIDARLADTNGKRRDAALRLLDLAEQQERTEIEAVLASSKASQAQKDIAQKRKDSLDAAYAGQRSIVDRQYEGAGRRYQREISAVGSDIGEAVDGVAVDGLRHLNDQLADAITGAKSLGDVFHNIAGQIIADLLRIAIQQAIIKPLAGALFGKADGSSSGSAGGLLTSLIGTIGGGGHTVGGSPVSNSLFDLLSQGNGISGRASGGYVGAGQLVRVNEAASPGNVEGFRPQGSGTIIPLGQMSAARSGGGGTTVIQHFSLDARGGLLLPDFVKGIQGYVDTQANQAAQMGASNGARIAVTQTGPSAQTLGTI